MKKIVKIAAVVVIAGTLAGGLSSCVSESDTVSNNLSTEAEQFKVARDVVFYNSITDKYMFEVKGLCSVDEATSLTKTLAVTCKIGKNKFVKEFLGKSDNVTWFAIQVQPVTSDPYHYEVVFKPETIIPNIVVDTSAGK